MRYHRLLSALLLLCCASQALAVTGVNPTGVNVRQSGPSTVFLTFQDLDPNEVAVDAFWCGQVNTTAVSATNPCVPGTLFGNLPVRNDLSRISSAGAFRNLTDIMTIPASVTRRAMQSAQQGNADFFYVRRFSGGLGGDRFVTVTCRIAGGGARTPLALLDVTLGFVDTESRSPVTLVERESRLPALAARIYYNGSGRLAGRWEVKLPTDPEPTATDLLSEGALPIEKRAAQRQYTLLDRFDIFLPPTGKAVIPGPAPAKLPTQVEGAYQILLRIEATDDKESSSDTLAGTVVSGGVAGFPLPVLRYFVGSADQLAQVQTAQQQQALMLFLPQQEAELRDVRSVEFSWVALAQAVYYEIEIGTEQDTIVSAVLPAGVLTYAAPPWLLDNRDIPLRWRVSALGEQGQVLRRSEWRNLTLR